MEFDNEVVAQKIKSTIDKIFPSKYLKYKDDFTNIFSFISGIDPLSIDAETIMFKLYHELSTTINIFFNLHPEINTEEHRTVLGDILMSVLAINFQGVDSFATDNSLQRLKTSIDKLAVAHPIFSNEDAMKAIHRLQAKTNGTAGYLIRHDKLLALDQLLIENDLMDKNSSVCPLLSIESTGQINKVNWKGEKRALIYLFYKLFQQENISNPTAYFLVSKKFTYRGKTMGIRDLNNSYNNVFNKLSEYKKDDSLPQSIATIMEILSAINKL